MELPRAKRKGAASLFFVQTSHSLWLLSLTHTHARSLSLSLSLALSLSLSLTVKVYTVCLTLPCRYQSLCARHQWMPLTIEPCNPNHYQHQTLHSQRPVTLR